MQDPTKAQRQKIDQEKDLPKVTVKSHIRQAQAAKMGSQVETASEWEEDNSNKQRIQSGNKGVVQSSRLGGSSVVSQSGS